MNYAFKGCNISDFTLVPNFSKLGDESKFIDIFAQTPLVHDIMDDRKEWKTKLKALMSCFPEGRRSVKAIAVALHVPLGKIGSFDGWARP